MKCTIPEISWHNRDPVYSVDIQPNYVSKNEDESIYRAATGGTDSHVLIWHIKVRKDSSTTIDFVADLNKHQRAVNVVRFSPDGQFLASGDDETVVILWKLKEKDDVSNNDNRDDLWDDDKNEFENKENWQMAKILRGHVEDVYDISWSPDSKYLVSGSVDNTAIIWNIEKFQKEGLLKDHKGFVQGVCWDPQNKYIATLSSDRVCRIFSIKKQKLLHRIQKSWLPLPGIKEDEERRLFYDDTFKSFFRRLTFTPCGELLITPSGNVELNPNTEDTDDDNKSNNKSLKINSSYLFSRFMFNKPAICLPTGSNYTIAVRSCPILYELRTDLNEEPLIPLPYRCIFAIATQDSVLLYDTQQSVPIGCVSNIHYTRLSDLSWSSDGLLLMISSTDGYCSIVTFTPGELGTPYSNPIVNQEMDITINNDQTVIESDDDDDDEIRLIYEDTVPDTISTHKKITPPNDNDDDEELAKPLDDLETDEKEKLDKIMQEEKSPNRYLSPKKAEDANVFLTPVKTNTDNLTPKSEGSRTPKRATLITLSSPKFKKNLYQN